MKLHCKDIIQEIKKEYINFCETNGFSPTHIELTSEEYRNVLNQVKDGNPTYLGVIEEYDDYRTVFDLILIEED